MNTYGTASFKRVEALRERFLGENVGAALLSDVANMRYITAFQGVFDAGISACVVLGADFARFYTDSRYIEAARTAAERDGGVWDVRLQRDSLFADAIEDLKADGIEELAMESSVPHSRFVFVSEKFGGRIVLADQWVQDLREVKDSDELAAAADAARLTDAALDHVLGLLRPGMREVDVALALETYMRSNGSEGLAFEPIVASGPNSSKPHAGISLRVIETGDFLTMDLGARVRGYCADLTRTVVVGARATDRQREIYAAVLAANVAGIEAVRAGAEAKAVDAVARDLLAGRGFREEFGHSLGHGVGLEVHENPRLSPKSDEILRVGQLVTVEPGVYLPGFGGVRIEDLVAVEDGGCRVLSAAPKELLEVL